MRASHLLAGLFTIAALCGCAGYRLGPTNGQVAGAKSVQVNFFENKTLEPRLSEAVGISLRRSLQQDGTYKLNTHANGDIVVNGELVSFTREGLSFQPRDIQSIRDFEVRLVAKVKAVDRATGGTLLDREVSGRTILRQSSDLNAAERQAIPNLADDLARNITSLLVDGSW